MHLPFHAQRVMHGVRAFACPLLYHGGETEECVLNPIGDALREIVSRCWLSVASGEFGWPPRSHRLQGMRERMWAHRRRIYRFFRLAFGVLPDPRRHSNLTMPDMIVLF